MTDLLERCADLPRRVVPPGAILVEQGDAFGSILVLVDGSVSIERDGVGLACLDMPGSILGEMSTVLARPAIATMHNRTKPVTPGSARMPELDY